MQQFKKEEVELVILSVKSDGKCAIEMKVYKNGTIFRRGAGGLPELGLNLMCFGNDSSYFDSIMRSVTQEMLDHPIDYQEPIPNGYLEYAIVFYGVSSNGDTGERAEWKKVTGTRFVTDLKSGFAHPIRTKIDTIVTNAAERSNELYFDAFMLVVYKANSSTLPKQTTISVSETGIMDNFENYLRQMFASTRGWEMEEFVQYKTYFIDDIAHSAVINLDNNHFDIRFIRN